MYKVFQEWRAATDPTEKRFLRSMLDNMQVDFDATRALMGGQTLAQMAPMWRSRVAAATAVRTTTAMRSRERRGSCVEARFFFIM